MSESIATLSRLQRWMQAVITHPEGIEAGLESDSACSTGLAGPGGIEQVVTRSAQLSSAERLGIYANAYFARLLECLRAEFPAVVQLVGQEAFDGFAFGFLQSNPSRSDTLAHLGESFPEFLEQIRPPGAGQRHPNFADFVIELARLERAYSEVFDEPGPEREPSLKPEVLQAIPPGAWENVRLEFYPCVRLLAFQFPVHEYALAVRRSDSERKPPAAGNSFLALTRREYVVHHVNLTHAEFVLLKRLQQGLTLGDATDSEMLGGAAMSERDLFAAFRDWTAAPLFARIASPSENSIS